MKIASIIFGIIGAIAGSILGLFWLRELDSPGVRLSQMLGEGNAATEINMLAITSYMLILCAIVGAVAVTLIILNKATKQMNGSLLIAAGSLPLLFDLHAITALPMVVGGIFAFFIKQKDVT